MRRIALLAATIGLTAAGLVAAAPAQAIPADPCGDVTYTVTPNASTTAPSVSDGAHTVLVGTSHKTITFDVQSDCYYWEVFIGTGAGDAIAHATWFRPTVAVRAAALDNIDAGADYPLLVRVRDSSSDPWFSNRDAIEFKRQTSWLGTFNASPEPIIEGARLNFRGGLSRANWDTQTWQRYGGRVTSLARNDSIVVSTILGDSNGVSVKSRRVWSSASWRLYYFGNATSGPSRSNADWVTVNVVDED